MKVTLLLFVNFLTCFQQDPVEQLLDKGYELYTNEKYEEAITTFDKALLITTENPELYLLRGLCLHGLGDVEQSIYELEKAIKLDPNYLEAYQEMGYIYLVGQAPQEAIKAYDKAISIDSEVAELYVNRGTAKCMLSDKAGAEADWKKAKSLGVDYAALMNCD